MDKVLHSLLGLLMHAEFSRNMFQSVKFLGIMRFAATYPMINQIFKFLMSSIPSMADKRKSHFEYTRKKTESRLDRQTDRKDFTTYVGHTLL